MKNFDFLTELKPVTEVAATFDISMVVCTYNPSEEVFSRVLRAITRLKVPGNTRVECVLVDNNSNPPLGRRAYIGQILDSLPWARIIREERQGLTHARICGISSTSAPIVIFLDDDNEADIDYLLAATQCLEEHPCVYAWGPGEITVEFLGRKIQEFRDEFAPLFQERKFECTQYGCVPRSWERYYPYGTGLIVRREVLAQYVLGVHSGRLSASDRNGAKLTSGGDAQLVWEAIKLGKAAGVCPNLRINHLIAAEKSTGSYIARQIYGTGSSYLPALVESFPEAKAAMANSQISNWSVAKKLAKLTLSSLPRRRVKMLKMDFARVLGPLVGLMVVRDDLERRGWVMRLVRALNLT